MLAFSIKEAFFKAFFPLCRRYLDFSDAWIEHSGAATPSRGRFTIVLPDPRLQALLCELQLEGRYAFDEQHVYSAVTLLHAEPADRAAN